MTSFDPCVTFDVMPCNNFCSQSPIDACDQVWSKSEASRRRSKLWEERKKKERKKERKKRQKHSKLRGIRVT